MSRYGIAYGTLPDRVVLGRPILLAIWEWRVSDITRMTSWPVIASDADVIGATKPFMTFDDDTLFFNFCKFSQHTSVSCVPDKNYKQGTSTHELPLRA